MTSNLIYYLSKHFSNGFMDSVDNLKSPQIQHDIYLVNCGLILSKINDKAEYI